MIKREFILQFYPTKYDYLTETNKIEYNGVYLKTSYLIDLMHFFIAKAFLFGKIEFNMYSPILQKKYGMRYKYYIDWLMDEHIIKVKSKWYSNKKAITYKTTIDFNTEKISRYKNRDKILLKKLNTFNSFERYKNDNFKLNNLKELIIEDLFHVNLDFKGAINELHKELDHGLLDQVSYNKNYIALEAIRHNQIYWNFDKFGRLHTNFTILKRVIRNNFLYIDNEKISEVDIPNSQPYFLSLLLNDILDFEDKNTDEYIEFLETIKYSTFYNSFNNIDLTRKEKKELVYKVFFDRNNLRERRNRIFHERWPLIWNAIKKWKEDHNSHAALAWELQRRESDLIFNKICADIKENYPNIRLFTVHDSVFFQIKYKHIIIRTFNKYLPHLKM